jgi:alpha-D-ribose 1-methylphosphonate 5-triphosphate synthase subunit PhnG
MQLKELIENLSRYDGDMIVTSATVKLTTESKSKVTYSFSQREEDRAKAAAQ